VSWDSNICLDLYCLALFERSGEGPLRITLDDPKVSMRRQNPEFSKDLSGHCLPSVSQYLPLRGETDKYELIINSETKDIKKGS
jgi:hypothetical protein